MDKQATLYGDYCEAFLTQLEATPEEKAELRKLFTEDTPQALMRLAYCAGLKHGAKLGQA